MNKKEIYIQKMKAQLDELQAEADKLKAKSSDISADAKLKLDKHLKDLQHQMQDVKEKLATLAKASDDAWDSIKDGLEASWSAISKAFSEAAGKFKK